MKIMKLNSASKFTLGFFVAFLFIIGTGVITWVSITRLVDDSRLVNHTHEVLGNLERIVSQLKDTETGQRGYVLTGDTAYLEPFYVGITGVEIAFKTVEGLTSDNPHQQKTLLLVEPLIEAKFSEMKQTIDLRGNFGLIEALKVIETNEGKNTMDELRVHIGEMQRVEIELLEQRASTTRNTAFNTKLTVISGTIVAIFIFGSIAFALVRSNSKVRSEIIERVGMDEVRLGLISDLEESASALTHSNQVLGSHNKITTIFAAVGDFETKATASLEVLVTLSESDWATIRLARPTEPGLHLAAAAGPAVAEFPPLPVFTQAQAISHGAFIDGKTVVIDDYANLAGASQRLVEMGMQSMLILPIRGRGRILGLITAISKERSHFSEKLVDRLNTVIDGLGIIIENSVLQDESQRDSLQLEQLTEELICSNQMIVESNELLEERVKIRTAEFESANERATRSERLAMIGQFSGGIAHDLRNPLGAIKNAVYLIMRKLVRESSSENIESITEYVELIDSEVGKANEVISNLLLSGSEKQSVFAEVSMSDITQKTLDNTVLKDNIELKTMIESKTLQVFGESSQLTRVIQNLVGNAQDAMERGGRLGVTVGAEENCAKVEISDTGCGIDPIDIDKIFDPLYTNKSSGTGLGLSICHDIITKHSGSICVDSEIGVGTTFTFRIPLLATSKSGTLS